MIGKGTQDKCLNRVIIGKSIFKAFQYNSTNTFASAVAVGRVVKSLAVPSPGEEVSAIKASGKVRIRQYICACNYD